MTTLTIERFEKWLMAYGKASTDNDPGASAALFAKNASYHETPFVDPLIGRQAIYEYWRNGAQTLGDKRSSFEILSIKDNLGIANWKAEFTVLQSGKRIMLDCIFLVEFDNDGTCCVFREWWHTQQISREPG